MIKSEVLDAMVAAGCTAEQVVAAVKADAQGVDARAAHNREVDAARKRRQREALRAIVPHGHADIDGLTVTPTDGADKPPSPKEIPQTPLEITPYPKTPSPPKGGSIPAEFELHFWPMYPHKVGKPEAAKKFATARKLASLQTIMDGLARYVAKTDDRPWCNPGTWLNQQRWADEPAVVARGYPGQTQPNSIHAAAANLARRLQDADDRSDQGNFADQPLAIGFSSRQ